MSKRKLPVPDVVVWPKSAAVIAREVERMALRRELAEIRDRAAELLAAMDAEDKGGQ